MRMRTLDIHCFYKIMFMTTIITFGVNKGQCIIVNSVRMQLFTKTKVGVAVQTGHSSQRTS